MKKSIHYIDGLSQKERNNTQKFEKQIKSNRMNERKIKNICVWMWKKELKNIHKKNNNSNDLR